VPGPAATQTTGPFPKVSYDSPTDVLYIALARTRTGYARAVREMPDIRLFFSDHDDEVIAIHVSRYSRQDPERLRGLIASVVDLPLPVARPVRRLP